MHREVVGIKRRKRTASERAGRERREQDQKRKSNLPTPQPHFYSNMRVKRCHSCFQPSLFSLFLYYPSPLALPLPLPIPFHFFPLSSCHASSHLQPHLLYSITAEQQGEGKIIIKKKKRRGEGVSPLGAASRTSLQLKDKSILKQSERLRVTRL